MAHSPRISCSIFLEFFVAISLQVFPLSRFHTLCWWRRILEMIAASFVTSSGGWKWS